MLEKVLQLVPSTQSITVQAQNLQPTRPAEGLDDPATAYGMLSTLISNLIGLALLGGAITAFIFLVIGAFQWGTAAAGDGRAKARKTMLYAAVGMIMLSLIYVVIFVYNSIFPAA